MVKLADIKAANSRLASRERLVVVSAGGTAGIGESSIRQLCAASGKARQGAGLQLYMIGRKQTTVDDLFKQFKELAPEASFTFIHATDLALLKNVDQACEQIIDLEKKRSGGKATIDILIMSQAIFDPWLGRKETSEGLDINMSLLYYSRLRIIDRLLPLLTARASSEEPAHVVSVYAAGAEKMGKLHADDLSLRKDYSFSDARTNVVHMKTMFFEHLAADYPGKLALVHVHPGLVITPGFKQVSGSNFPWWIRTLTPLLLPIARLTVATPVPESGQRTLFLATDRYPASGATEAAKKTAEGLPFATASNGVLGGGAYSCSVSAETNNGLDKVYTTLRQGAFYECVWSHTHDAFRTIESGSIFRA